MSTFPFAYNIYIYIYCTHIHRHKGILTNFLACKEDNYFIMFFTSGHTNNFSSGLRDFSSIQVNFSSAVVWKFFIYSFSNFQCRQSVFQILGDCSKGTDNNWYHFHFHISQFLISSKVQVFIQIFVFFHLHSVLY